MLSESPESAGALEVAPINVVSEDEIGQVARAFDQVHSEAVRLAGEQASLELQEAKLVSPARMEQLARQQQFIDPEPEKVVYLDSKDGSSYALNQALNKKQ